MFSRITMTALICSAALGCTAEWIIPKGYIVECTDNSDCPDTAECTLADDGQTRVCVTAGETWCGNGVQEVGEACDDGDDNTAEYGTSARCNLDCSSLAPHCGDGEVNGGEECDSGENNSEEYGEAERCNSSCNGTAPHCGDGEQNGGEACDSGESNSDAYGSAGRCNTTCTGLAPSCGDGLTNGAEVCDDGASNTDGYSLGLTCNTACTGFASYCGDGERDDEDGEACDNPDPSSGCTATCEKSPDVECGDLVTHSAFEQCDDGNTVTESCDYEAQSCLVCDATCQVATPAIPGCGDGIIQNAGGDAGKEACDGSIPCSELHAVFESGTALCGDDCQAIDSVSCQGLPTDMVLVPQGFFWMGCNSAVDDECSGPEYPYHEVYLDSFLIDRTEVTAVDYEACVQAGACTYSGSTTGSYRTYNNNRDNHPINYVNHTEAKTYCEAQGKRLPTEAEWEKAARGTDGRKYPWGNSPAVSCDYAVMGSCPGETQPVGSKPLGVSPYGAHDMIGNLWEWTADWYDAGYYGETPAEGWVNPEGPDSGVSRVLRGGSWYDGNSVNLRASFRYLYSPSGQGSNLGFRCSQ